MNHRLSTLLRAGIEAVLLSMIAIAPWLFGAVHPFSELLLTGGLALVLLLWAARMIVTGSLLWKPCGFTIGLGCLTLLGALQTWPLSDEALHTLSPATARLYDQLVPAEMERPDGTDGDLPARKPCTVSVAPDSTKHATAKLIALLAFFAAARANLTAAAFSRLALVALINGVLLALIGLLQFFSSPRHVVFWLYPSEGNVFGPFICRNHFACYMNLSLGLGVGLLLAARGDNATPRSSSFFTSLHRLLERPAVLWIASGLTFIGASLVCSLSRGGVVAFLAASLVSLVIVLWRSSFTFRFRSGSLLTAIGLAFVVWFTYDLAGSRLATLWRTNVLDEGRGPMWDRLLELVPEFPVLGTGLGTFSFVEPLTRRPADTSGVLHSHAHNDFLEALIEGGVVQLAIVAALIALLIRAGISANVSRREVGPVVGLVFGLTAVIVHSTVDFGMHIPAVALLATLVAALLMNLAEPEPTEESSGGASAKIAAGVGVLALVGLAFFLVEGAWRRERAERYRLAATRVTDSGTRVAYLESAIAYSPDDPLLRVALAEAHRQRFVNDQTVRAFRLATLALASDYPLQAPGILALWDTASVADRSDLRQALRQHLWARALCPLLPQPHLFLAGYPKLLARSDTTAQYLERSCQLDPSNAKAWYFAGRAALDEGHNGRAWTLWRRSLECSSAHLPEILAATSALDAAEIVAEIMPADSALLYRAAGELEQSGRAPEQIEVVLMTALQGLDRESSETAERLLLRARIEARLRRTPAARASFEKALRLAPERADWRLEFAEFLVEIGSLTEARHELNAIRHSDGKAAVLYQSVIRAISANAAPGAEP